MQTTGTSARRRTCRARSARADVVSGTAQDGEPRWCRRRRGGRGRRPRRGPRRRRRSRGRRSADPRSPRTALPGRRVRESIDTPATEPSRLPAARCPPVASLTSLEAERRAESAQGRLRHALPRIARRERRSRATWRSSKGIVRSRRTWVVSCPFPAMTTASPGPRQLQRLRDGVAPVHDHVALDLPAVHPRLDLVEDRLGGLAPRVVGGHDHDVGQARRHRPHERALGAVAVAAASEDGDDPAGGELPHRLQEVLEGVVGVGVVHDHREVLSRVHALQASRDASQGLEPLEDRLPGQAEGQAGPEGREDVLDVEAPEQGRLHREVAGGRPGHEGGPREGEGDAAGSEVRGAIEGVGEDAPAGRARPGSRRGRRRGSRRPSRRG